MGDTGTLRLLFLTANLFFWLVGAGLLGFVGWTLSSLPNTSGFMSGSFLILYAGIAIGLLVGLDGLLGCLGGMFGSMLLLKLYIGFSILFGVVEVVLILAVYVQKDKIPSMLEATWNQVNEEARYTIQESLKCCGINTYTEYGTDYSEFPDSCFKKSEIFDTIVAKKETTLHTHIGLILWIDTAFLEIFIRLQKVTVILWYDQSPSYSRPKTSCLSAIQTWLSDNMVIWIAVLVGIALIQIISGMLSCQVFTRLHEQCRVEPMKNDDKKDEEAPDEKPGTSQDDDLNDLEEKSDRNIPIDGASCSSHSPSEQNDHKKTNEGVIDVYNLDSQENEQEYTSEKKMEDKNVDFKSESNMNETSEHSTSAELNIKQRADDSNDDHESMVNDSLKTDHLEIGHNSGVCDTIHRSNSAASNENNTDERS